MGVIATRYKRVNQDSHKFLGAGTGRVRWSWKGEGRREGAAEKRGRYQKQDRPSYEWGLYIKWKFWCRHV